MWLLSVEVSCLSPRVLTLIIKPWKTLQFEFRFKNSQKDSDTHCVIAYCTISPVWCGLSKNIQLEDLMYLILKAQKELSMSNSYSSCRYVSLSLLILPYFNCLTTEMELIYTLETTNNTAFSLQYMSTYRCISQTILGTRRRKVGRLGALQVLSSFYQDQSGSFHFLRVSYSSSESVDL